MTRVFEGSGSTAPAGRGVVKPHKSQYSKEAMMTMDSCQLQETGSTFLINETLNYYTQYSQFL